MSNEFSDDAAALQEELASARAEIERLSEAAADREALAAQLREGAGALRSELSAAQAELDEARRQASHRDGELTEAREQLSIALGKYREAVVAAEPWLPAEALSGGTTEAFEESLAHARYTAAQVRERLEGQGQAQRVPAGAPARRGPDLSSLSPLDKIKRGLEQ